jgi:CheY-like chemotaxis protein
VQFDVVDTGIGIDPEIKDRLFEPFSQADTSTARQFGGTGLGLVISKRFAEMLGGGVEIVDTAPGLGTRFRVTVGTGPADGVRLLEGIQLTMAAINGPSSACRPEVAELDCRVLLVEDGPDNQRLISFMLKKLGAEVTLAGNGAEAIEKALANVQEGQPFDVILMDMQMPVMDGYDATRRLRQTGYTQPIVALTAHAMAPDREKCMQAGCDDYLTKPTDRAHLADCLLKWIRQQQPCAAAT